MDITQFRFYQKMAEYKAYWKYRKKLAPIKKSVGKVLRFTRNTHISANSILIVEPNPFHAETIPGYVQYFLELGYQVDVFMTYENAFEKPFCRMTNSFRIFVGDYKDIQRWLTYSRLNCYKIIFFSTLFYNLEHLFLPVLLTEDIRKRVFGIAHSPEIYDNWLQESPARRLYEQMLREKRFASLSKLDGFYRINPNYFGNVVEESFQSNKVIFLAVGAISASCKNHALLLHAVRELLASGNENFEIHVVGSGSMSLPDDVKPFIKLCGRLDFPSMYAELERASFILALLDPFNPSQLIYLHGTTSGSLQLSLGFLRPLIINSQFADAYSLSPDSAVTYNDNELSFAMQQALNFSCKQYRSIQEGLLVKRDKIRQESLQEIKDILHRIN